MGQWLLHRNIVLERPIKITTRSLSCTMKWNKIRGQPVHSCALAVAWGFKISKSGRRRANKRQSTLQHLSVISFNLFVKDVLKELFEHPMCFGALCFHFSVFTRLKCPMNEHVNVLRESMLCSRRHKVVPERLLGAKHASNSGSANLFGGNTWWNCEEAPAVCNRSLGSEFLL